MVHEAPEPSIQPAQAEPTSGKLFKDISDYEASADFNPSKRVLSPAERLQLVTDLRSLEERARAATVRHMIDAQDAIERMRENGMARAVDSRGAKPSHGALVTDVRTTRDGTTVVELYEHDFPEASRYRAELDSIREQGLAVVRDYFRHQ
ncbi:MAG: hypothetical protein JNN27_10285 [Planctomycetes bacterium]|nr:hypothetical protein [Planctomycetota bacterium]